MPKPTNPKDTDRRKRQAIANVRLLPEENAKLQAYANQRQIRVAEVLRRALSAAGAI